MLAVGRIGGRPRILVAPESLSLAGGGGNQSHNVIYLLVLGSRYESIMICLK